MMFSGNKMEPEGKAHLDRRLKLLLSTFGLDWMNACNINRNYHQERSAIHSADLKVWFHL